MGRMLRMVRIFMAVCVMAMPAFGGGRDVHDLYGAPAMYGEPERDMPTRDTLLKMYGTPPAARARPISAPIVTSPGGDRRPARPPRAAPKQAAKKKTSTAPKPQVKKPALVKKQVPASGAATPAKTAPSPAVVAAPDVPAAAAIPSPGAYGVVVVASDAPSSTPQVRMARPRIPVGPKYARGIARHVRNGVDVDAFCEKIRPRPRGPLPDGLILMPGRPDLMCCVK